jgi:hypothetical protein
MVHNGYLVCLGCTNNHKCNRRLQIETHHCFHGYQTGGSLEHDLRSLDEFRIFVHLLFSRYEGDTQKEKLASIVDNYDASLKEFTL